MLLKKLVILGIIAALAQSVSSLAEEFDYESITAEQLNREAPLTQEDVDILVKFYHLTVVAVNTVRRNPATTVKELDDLVAEFVEANKITPIRLRYIAIKIQAVMVGLDDSNQMPKEGLNPPFMVPGSSELNLIKQNRTKLAAALALAKALNEDS
ncbi:MAG: hypothetical protein LBP22_01610 [Deltaproteobacteria bacterium]|jgi:hypothetical protein|nr:hypothetical protein [Deltaproteobacteria bacterium]